ncbi:MAG TPA: LON peptidase substrate-binding domain-containing protein [Vicinamibacteria bacterium]
MDEPSPVAPRNYLLPVVPLKDHCLFPGAVTDLALDIAGAARAIETGLRNGGRVLALGTREIPAAPRDLSPIGTIAEVGAQHAEDGAARVELVGLGRARVVASWSGDSLVAEVEPIAEGDAGDEWGPAVEALARYLHAHASLRELLDGKRRSADPMAWVNLACQILPITASARQKLLEADAAARCLKISRGLDALLRKEQSA